MKCEMTLGDCVRAYAIPRKGVLHVGAGFCEEGPLYKELGFERVVWVEALPDELERRQQAAAALGQTLVIAALDDRARQGIEFHVTSNSYSSSLLSLGTHTQFYPEVTVNSTIQLNTTTGGAFMKAHPEGVECNVLSVDVQGAELRVLRGFGNWLRQFDCILSEVYLGDVYVGCGKLQQVDALLFKHGFVRVETWIKPGEGWGDAFWVKQSLL